MYWQVQECRSELQCVEAGRERPRPEKAAVAADMLSRLSVTQCSHRPGSHWASGSKVRNSTQRPRYWTAKIAFGIMPWMPLVPSTT